MFLCEREGPCFGFAFRLCFGGFVGVFVVIEKQKTVVLAVWLRGQTVQAAFVGLLFFCWGCFVLRWNKLV